VSIRRPVATDDAADALILSRPLGVLVRYLSATSGLGGCREFEVETIMAERYPEAELVLDEELVYDEAPRRSVLRHTDERIENVVREGEVLAGKYRVERIPGRNGLGVLVQVRHMELGQEVTLKFLIPEACAYPEFVHRFVREARSAVRIQGEHVARITDVGRLESGAPYMVREFLRGPDLAEVLKVRGPLPVMEAVDYVVQACEGVAEGHALGVVHRNIRPTTLIVTRRSDGTALVKVFDFAAAESLHVDPFTERAVSLVGTSAIMASLPYLAPEQIRDPHDVDFRADVYSLGAVLFELLTGTAVYSADAAPALLAQVAADPAASARALRPDLPGELDHIVLRCLAKNRAIRYGSVAELVIALAPYASQDSSSSIDHIVRLGKRTSKLPDHSERRPSSLPPPTPTHLPAVNVASDLPPARARHDTLPLHTTDVAKEARFPSRSSVHDDVTAINPYAAYAAPVVIHPASAKRERVRTQPLPLPSPPPAARTAPANVEPPPVLARRTPIPPPIRASVPPPLQEPAAPPIVAPPPAPAHPPPSSHLSGTDTTALPPPRSSVSGLSRSWVVPDEPSAPLFTKNRLIAVGAMAAAATLAAVIALRAGQPAPVAAAAPSVVAAPAKVEPPPAPPPAPEPAPQASVSAVPSASAVPVPVAAPPTPGPVAAQPPLVAAAAPVPVAARPAAPMPASIAPKPVVVAKRPAARDDSGTEPPRKPALAEKVASSRPAGGDLFDDPN
jgi:serine/threonine-protein kinase